MKQKKLLPSLLVVLFVFLSSCKDTNPVIPTTTTELVPGRLDVRFTQNISPPQANAFLMDLSLQPIDLSSLESRLEYKLDCRGSSRTRRENMN